MADQVLVTGISGFIAAHVTERLLAKGYAVRGTVRNKVKGQKIARMRVGKRLFKIAVIFSI